MGSVAGDVAGDITSEGPAIASTDGDVFGGDVLGTSPIIPEAEAERAWNEDGFGAEPGQTSSSDAGVVDYADADLRVDDGTSIDASAATLDSDPDATSFTDADTDPTFMPADVSSPADDTSGIDG